MGRILIVVGLGSVVLWSVAFAQESGEDVAGDVATEAVVEKATEVSEDVAGDVVEEGADMAEAAVEKKPLAVKMFPCQNVAATEAAKLLGELTDNAVKITADPRTNILIVAGTNQQLETVEALLKKLDQAPKRVALDFTFADLPAQKSDLKNNASQTSTEYWLKRVRSKDGADKGNINEVRLTAMDRQKAMVQYGAVTPVITGLQQRFAGRGGSTPTLQQTQTGTLIECEMRITADGRIIAGMKLERSQIAPEIGAVLEETDDKNTVRAPGTLTTTCQTTLSLKPGVPQVVCGMNSQQGKTGTHSVIVVTAEILGEVD